MFKAAYQTKEYTMFYGGVAYTLMNAQNSFQSVRKQKMDVQWFGEYGK